jgi:hypothetical protein
LKPWRKQMWCIPPEGNAEFVWAMENVLEVYRRPYDPAYPVVCMDETSKQLVGETRTPVAVAPGRPARHDYEYERRGTANIFMFVEPLAGWRGARITDRRTTADWAEQVRNVVDSQYPSAKRVTLVMDNLNTHGPASFYETFPPAEARRLVERIEMVRTPKHGSWLNIAEIEFNVMGRQCLAQRIGDKSELCAEVSAWNAERNGKGARVDWQFHADDARIKLKRLYPVIRA